MNFNENVFSPSPNPELKLWDLPLKGKIAIVTGSSRGLGKSIAIELARRGADIVLTFTNERSGRLVDEVAREIGKLPHKPYRLSVRADLAGAGGGQHVVEAAQEWWNKWPAHKKTQSEFTIDILVNNAGTQAAHSVYDITPEDYAKVYDLNVRGTLLMTQATLPHLSRTGTGRIINISSVGARTGFANMSLYCSSKAALEGLTRCWAAELGKHGTTVNAVAPGPVQSALVDQIPEKVLQIQKATTPLQARMGTTDEIAEIVAWLAGQESRWITGQVISASGGWAMY